MSKNTSSENNGSTIYDDSPMFLDTIELVIHLLGPIESTFDEFSFENRKVWKLDYGKGYKTYIFIKNKSFTLSEFKYKPSIKYRIRYDWRGVALHELLVECSIPKLLLGNNYIDAQKGKLSELYLELLDTINYVYHFEDITLEMLENATLKRMDCGSQVFFPDRLSYDRAYNRILSARLDPRIELGAIKYSNMGSGLSILCESWQFAFYDKTEELKKFAKSRKKAKFEQDNEHLIDLNILLKGANGTHTIDPEYDEDIENPGKDFFNLITTTKAVCMRFELRLNTKDKIDRALKRIGEPSGYITLKEALDKNIPQRILQWHCRQLFKSLPRYDLTSASDEDILSYVAELDSKPDNMAKNLGYITMERMLNQKRVRDIITNGKSQSAWTTFLKKMKNMPVIPNLSDPIQLIINKVFGELPSGITYATAMEKILV